MLIAALLITLLYSQVKSDRILAVYLVPSISHQEIFLPITKELSLRGHEVVVVTAFPYRNPSLANLTEIDVSYQIAIKSDVAKIMSKDLGATGMIRGAFLASEILLEYIFTDENFKNIYTNPKEHFDLIMVEGLTPVLYGLSSRFQAPVIGMISMDGLINNHESIGNTNHPALYTDMLLPYTESNFYHRLQRVYHFLWYNYFYHWEVIPRANEIARKFLGADLPDLWELERNLSMLFINVNPIIYPVRPTTPNTIHLSKMHIKPRKPLPKDLTTLLDDCKEGFIYLSLGTNVKSHNMPPELLQIITSAVAEVPYPVLWKWDLDHFPNQPKNVVTRKWFPQQDILAHPNIKAFITQGGLQSAEEAIVNEVPLVGIPFLADQPRNIQKFVEIGMAQGVDPNTVTKDQLKSAIMEVAGNPKYKKKVQEVNNLIYDEPMTGLERAVWWTEYVLRHKGSNLLRSPTTDLPWHHFLFLDLVGAALALALLLSWIVFKTSQVTLALLKSNKKPLTTKKSN